MQMRERRGVVKRPFLTLRNAAKSMDYRADRHRTYTPINSPEEPPRSEDPYTLDQLASVIPFGWEPPTVRQTGVGRNVDLFEAGMRWAGRRTNEHLGVLPALLALNQDFHHPLPLSEVQATAKQIEKYRRRWAPQGWHCPRWIKKQAARSAKQTGKARKASASREGSNEALRPWEAEGISRRTWYRRHRVAREVGTIPNTDKRGNPCP